MDKILLQVFEELKALTPEQLAHELSMYRNDPLAITLQFLDEGSREVGVFSKNEIEINRSDAQPQVKDEDLYDWIYAANDERFALAA